MSQWPTVALGEVCEINPRLKAEQRPSGDAMVGFVPMAAVDETDGHIAVTEERSYSTVSKGYTPFRDGDVLFAKITPCMENGKAALVSSMPNGLGFGSTEFHILRAKGRILPELIFHFVRQSTFRSLAKANFTGTAGQQRVPTRFLEDTRIPLPPLGEQRRIVDLLERAAGIRRLREQALAKARAIVPALFLDMFGDPAINPKGWPISRLGDILAEGPQNGLYRPASDYGTGTQILRIDSFDDGTVHDLESLRRLRIDTTTVARYRLVPGDILINRVNSPPQLGKSALIPPLAEPVVFESNMMRLRVDQELMLPEVAIEMLQLQSVRRALTRNAKHAINQSSINQGDVTSVRVILPPNRHQQAFADRLGDLRSIVAQQERSLATAQKLERSLMAQLLG